MQRIPIVVLDPAGADSTKTVPTYNPATGLVEWAAGGGGGGSIDALSDVDTSTVAPTAGEALLWDGVEWKPGTPAGNVPGSPSYSFTNPTPTGIVQLTTNGTTTETVIADMKATGLTSGVDTTVSIDLYASQSAPNNAKGIRFRLRDAGGGALLADSGHLSATIDSTAGHDPGYHWNWSGTVVPNGNDVHVTVQIDGSSSSNAIYSDTRSMSVNQDAVGPNLDWLDDVTITNPVSGQILTFDGSIWKNGASPAIPAGGGAGQVLKKASVTDFDVVWGDDLQGSGGSGAAYPLGSADKPPSTPNAKDDEFDGSSTVTWTTTPTSPTATDRNTTRPGHLYIKTAGGGGNYVGRYQPVPAAYPYTITAKLAGSTGRANYHRAGGVILTPAAPTASSNVLYAGAIFNGSRAAQRSLAQFNGTFVSQSGTQIGGYWGAIYIKVVVASATSVSTYASTDGYAWFVVETGFNPGFAPAFMGLAINEENSGGGVEAFFDFFRVS